MKDRVLHIALGVVASIVVVYFAAKWLGREHRRTPEELLNAALADATLVERESAAVALIDAGAQGTPSLRQLATQSGDDQVRAAAIEGLGRNADFESMDVLLAALDDESEVIRGRAGVVVGRMLGRDRRFRADAPLEDRVRIAGFYRDDWEFLRSSPNFESYKQRFRTP